MTAGAAAVGIELGGHPKRRPVVKIYGSAGSFAGLAGASHLPGGQPISTVEVPFWRFGPGQGVFGCTIAQDGSIIIGTTPFTDNQLRPTAADMEVGVLSLDPLKFDNIVVPSTTGRTMLPGIGTAGLGGGDVSAVVGLPGTHPPRALFVSTAPYHGWDVGIYGELPSLGQLSLSKRTWEYDPAESLTADALAARTPASQTANTFPKRAIGPRDNRGTADVVILPHSGHAVVAQYFGSFAQQSGGLFAFDPRAGKVVSSWQNPPIDVFGQAVFAYPRQLAADPSSSPGDERFVVIYDTFDAAGATVPFPVQEFSYRAGTATITPVSTAVRSAQDGTRMEMAQFLRDGTLIVARTEADGLTAATLAVYQKRGRERSLTNHPPSNGIASDRFWGSTCPPDSFVSNSGRGGLVRSLVVDDASDRVFVAGLNGLFQTVSPNGHGTNRSWATTNAFDLGLSGLRSPQRYPIGVRQGAVDLKRRLLWLPCNQLTLNLLPWPVPAFVLDQWIYAISIDEL